MQARLLGRDAELYADVDRLQSEASLRFALVPPLLGVGGALLDRGVWWALPTLAAVSAVLGIQGSARRMEAGDKLVDAVTIARVGTPVFESFDATLTELPRELQTWSRPQRLSGHLDADPELRRAESEDG